MEQSTVEGIRYQLLQAPPSVIHFAGDLKYGNLLYFSGKKIPLYKLQTVY